jgi:hypothetical protein
MCARCVPLGIRILDGERDLRGLGGHLLCADARAGAAQPGGQLSARGRDADDGAGCNRSGQVFWYTVEGPYDSGTLHSIQDWFIKYQLNSVPGVAEVASVGGFVKQYQIDLDPIKLRAYNIPLKDVVSAVERSNNNVGAKVMEAGDTEEMVRGIGLIRGLKDIETFRLAPTTARPSPWAMWPACSLAPSSAAAFSTRTARKQWAEWSSSATAPTRAK